MKPAERLQPMSGQCSGNQSRVRMSYVSVPYDRATRMTRFALLCEYIFAFTHVVKTAINLLIT